MLGMLSLGVVADRVGRRRGSLACAAFMLLGGVLLTCSSGPSLAAWALMFAVSQVASLLPWPLHVSLLFSTMAQIYALSVKQWCSVSRGLIPCLLIHSKGFSPGFCT